MLLDAAQIVDPVLFAMVLRHAGVDPTKIPMKPIMSEVLFHQPRRYECHITIEPVFDQLLEDVRAIAEADVHGFKVADLFMQKRPEDAPERSKFDTFITGHSVSSESYNGLLQRARGLARILCHQLEVKVYRIKVEEILFDERYGGMVK